MQAGLKSIEEQGIQLVAISYDSVDVLKTFADKQKITFSLLSDPDSKVIDSYKLRNEDVNRPRMQGIPHPGTILVDKEGVVRAKLFIEDYKKRHPPEAIVEAAKEKLPSSEKNRDD